MGRWEERLRGPVHFLAWLPLWLLAWASLLALRALVARRGRP